MPADALLLIGPTGSGKTPLGDLFEQKGINGTRCLHFDFGSELRSIAGEAGPPGGFEDREHSFIKDVLEKGLLLENEHFHIAGKIVLHFMRRKGYRAGDLLVLNGLPRHRGQAEDMKGLVKFRGLMVLDCAAETVFVRISENSGGDRTGRADDGLALVRKKLQIFSERTEPLIDYFTDSGIPVHRFPVTPSSTADDLYYAFRERMDVIR